MKEELFNISRKKIIAIFIGTITALFLFVIAIFSSNIRQASILQEKVTETPTQSGSNTTSDSPQPSNPTGQYGSEKVSLNFSQKYIDASESQGRVDIDIVLNTQQTKSSGVYLEILYDPEDIADVEIIPSFDGASLYGQNSDITNLSHSPQEGSFVLGISTLEAGSSVEGKGRIATLSFRPLKSSSQETTTLSFSAQSESILGSLKYRAESGKLEAKIK